MVDVSPTIVLTRLPVAIAHEDRTIHIPDPIRNSREYVVESQKKATQDVLYVAASNNPAVSLRFCHSTRLDASVTDPPIVNILNVALLDPVAEGIDNSTEDLAIIVVENETDRATVTLEFASKEP